MLITQGAPLFPFAECFGFYKVFGNYSYAPSVWLTSYGTEVGITASIPFGIRDLGGSFVAKPAAISRGAITRTMDPRDTQIEITVQGVAGAHKELMHSLINNYIIVTLWQDPLNANENKIMSIGEGVPTAFDGDSTSFIVREDRKILDRLLPDIVYQKMCNNILFGRRCGLNWRQWGITAQWGDLITVTNADYWAGHSHWEFTHSFRSAFPDNYFMYGTVTVGDWGTSQERRVINWDKDGLMACAPSFDRKIRNNEIVHILPGCDKAITTCSDKFGNKDNFFGFPELPTKNPATQGMF